MVGGHDREVILDVPYGGQYPPPRRRRAVWITVKVRPGDAPGLHGTAPPSPDAAGLRDTAARLGLSLVPQHPGETDPLLAPYFTAEVADPALAESALSALRDSPAVEAAYVKPAEEPP
jgi:hypothetical protein